MPPPEGCGARRWLFPPAVGRHVVGPAVAVDVTDAHAVTGVLAPWARLGDRRRHPLAGWGRGVRLGIAQSVVAGVDDLWPAIAVDVLEQRLLVANRFEDDVRVPTPVLTLRIDVERADPVAGIAAHVEDVRPAITGPVV